MNYLELTESFTSKVVNKAKNTSQEDKRQNIIQIQFEDPEVERICHEHGVYTIEDASKVTTFTEIVDYVSSFGGKFKRYKRWFEKSQIKNFKEFKYFTGLKKIEDYTFYDCFELETIHIPDNIEEVGNVWLTKSMVRGSFLKKVYMSKKCPAYLDIMKYIRENVTAKAVFIDPDEEELMNKAKEKGFKFDFDKALTESFTSNVIKKTKETTQEDKRKKLFGDYVDLDLPSGTLWCKHNYGVENETDYGELYNHDEASKLDMTPGQLPSKEDFEELFRCCITKFTEINGVYGELFTSIINKESIFFPAAGVIDSTSNFHSRGKIGNYWSSTYHIERKEQPHTMFFREGTIYPSTCYHKDLGFSVRSVLKKNKIEESFTSNVIDKAKKITQKDKRNIVAEYVDLDLPSGILWSKYNIGASKESDFGDYLYFNDIKDKDKIPLRSDYQELVRNCNCEHDEINGVHGFKISSRKDPSKYIFFPYAGILDPTRSTNFVYEENQKGFYFIGDIDKKTPKDYRDIFYLLKKSGFIGYTYEFRYVNPDIRKCSLRTIRRKDINESFTSKVVKSYEDKDKKKEEIKNGICPLSDYIVQNLEKECTNNNLHIEDFAVYDNSSSYDDMSNDFNITFNLIYEDVDNNNVTIEVEISIVEKSITMYAMDTNYEYQYIDDDGTNIEGNSYKEYVEGIIDRLKGYLDTIRNRIDDNEKWKEYEKDRDDEAAWNDPNYIRDEEDEDE